MRLGPFCERLLAAGLSLCLLIILSGCSPDSLQKGFKQLFVPKEADELSRVFIEHLRAGRVSEAVALVDPSLQIDRSRASLQKLSDDFQHGEVKSVEILSSQAYYPNSGLHQIDLGYEIELTTGWFNGHVKMTGKNDSLNIQSAYFVKADGPVPQVSMVPPFELKEKSSGQLGFFALCCANVVFILFTALACLLSHVRWKLLWFVFILLGFCSFSMNWTTGETTFAPLYVSILGAAIFIADSSSPWILSVSIPVGALLFWMPRKPAPDEPFVRTRGLKGRRW